MEEKLPSLLQKNGLKTAFLVKKTVLNRKICAYILPVQRRDNFGQSIRSDNFKIT